jgi:murein DD-endopeptidase MepM/ murein hydrolase activator NlpD
VTSEFGNRLHPTLNVMKMHNGIDIGASYGADIVAAYDGTVVAASYNSSMGNYVMIDHGDELYTVYMHCSSLNTTVGATVKAGQSIAKVGATGWATGNHLHFGVRLNGSYVTPWNYLN